QQICPSSLPGQFANCPYEVGAYCIKRVFQDKKTFEIKLMSIRFSVAKKGLFPLFREFIAGKSTFISFFRHFIALKTVVVPIRRRSPFK
ncbi:hypothetical protein, partial [uncultured Parabacteroides sp.]|uniref:hypothetical protein n=1 Tax=uncultured Parabacteroides sp. TaxID=512312 RepID=UPI0025EB1529